MTAVLRRSLGKALRSVWTFVADDAPEMVVVVAAVVGAAYALRHGGAAPVVVLPLLVVAGLGLAVWRTGRVRTDGGGSEQKEQHKR